MSIAELEGVEKIKALDLEPIVFKLTASEKGRAPELTLAQEDAGVELYRQFLILNLLYPEKSIVPTEQIDTIWHTHILDTAKYREDCQNIFGRPLDHFPYLGLRGPDDVEKWQAAFAETQQLFRQHFGTELGADSEACGNSCGTSLCDGGACNTSSCSASHNVDRSRPRPERVPA